jgi:hypothetical protein
MQVALPGIRDASIAGGAYGGGRQDLQENRAVQDFSRAATDATSRIGYQDFNDWRNLNAQEWDAERNRQQGAGNLFQQMSEFAMAPGRLRMDMAQAAQARNQGIFDNARAMWEERNRVAPTWGIQPMANLLTTGGFGTTHTTGTQINKQPDPSGGPLMQGLQAALGLGSMFTGMGAAGARVGGIGNLFRW